MNELEIFVKSVLDDDNGISQKSYELLLDLSNKYPELNSLISSIDATEGRFYLKEVN